MFAEFVKLHFSPTNQELELLQETKDCNPLYLTAYRKTQPEIITDHLTKWNQPMSQWLTSPVLLWQIPNVVLDQLNKGYFSLHQIAKNHGEQRVNITSIDDTQTQMKLSTFIEYLTDKESFNKKKQQYPSNISLINHYIEDWDQEATRLYEYIPSSVQRDDGLSYLRKEIKNVNQLLMNIMSEGFWIGGHQQSTSSLHLNHGPGECVWTIIDPEYVEPLYNKHPNLLKTEGKWIKSAEFFFQNKIPYRRFIQKPGDLLFLGAGTIIQIQCTSTTILTGWSFLPLNNQTYNQIYKQIKFNDKHNIKQQIPFRNLLLDIYIHNRNDQLAKYIQEFLDSDMEIFSYLKKQKKIYSCDVNYYFRKYCICSECKGEILLACYKANQKVYCMRCEKAKHIQLVCKYNPQLLFLAIRDNEQLKCSSSYCAVYNSPYNDCQAKCQPSKKETQQEVPPSIKESSTSNIELVPSKRKYIANEEEEEKEVVPKTQRKNTKKTVIKIEDDCKVKIENVKVEAIKSEKKQRKPPTKEPKNVIIIKDEAPNLRSYPIKTRQREEILIKLEQEIAKPSKTQAKTQKQKAKLTSTINKSKLTEEEINNQLGIIRGGQNELGRILKKGEKQLVL